MHIRTTRRARCALLGAALLLAVSAGAAHAQDRWTEPHPGVRRLARTTSTPWRINVLQVDLCADGIALRATTSQERRRTTSSFASAVGAIAAVNGDFFSYATYATSGLAVGQGQRWADTDDDNGSGLVAFGDDRLLLALPAGTINPAAWMRQVVSGHPGLVDDGRVVARDTSEFCQTRHPRTALGLSADNRTLILAVVDGRSSSSAGMRCTELGELMVEMGAARAINLDGGGSSTMWVRGTGVVNRPSDGGERTVANHLAVLLQSGADPGSCERTLEAGAFHAGAVQGSTSTDIDGDGLADLCGRGGEGIECALSQPGGGFSAVVAGPGLRDDNGWRDPSNWATIQLGDVTGDGRADLCARANAGMRCWPSTGDGFGAAILGPEWSDAAGWDAPSSYGTIRLADIDGDGLADLCARAAEGFRCHPATGAGFGPAVALDALKDSGGWDQVRFWGTLRMGDIDGDGRADLCARAGAGMRCWRSTGTGWRAAVQGPEWSDAAGWDAVRFWSTIRLADIDGDGRADLCARGSAGVRCHLSRGDGFGPALEGPAWSDERGWADYGNHSTLLLGDIDGDGDRDLCARADAGVSCARFNGEGFDAPQRLLSALTDESGWNRLRFYSTLHLADVTGDGRADLCARANAGMRCWPSNGDAFSPDALSGPVWSGAEGWGEDHRFSTIRIVAPAAAERCEGGEGCGEPDADAGPDATDADGTGDASPGDDTDHAPDDAPSTGDASAEEVPPDAPSGADAAGEDTAGGGSARVATYEEGCATAPGRTSAASRWLLGLLAALLWGARWRKH